MWKERRREAGNEGRCSRHQSFLHSNGSDDDDVRWATWASRNRYYKGGGIEVHFIEFKVYPGNANL